MSQRQLISASSHTNESTFIHQSTAFKLQPPPLKKREKRRGRLFASSVNQGILTPISPFSPETPNSNKDTPSEEGNVFKENFNFSSSTNTREKHNGMITFSPKHILPNDDRLFFHSMPEEDDEDVDEMNSGQSTPKQKDFNTKVMDGEHKAVSNTSSMTTGTFGVLRRRSSVHTTTNTAEKAHTTINTRDNSIASETYTFGQHHQQNDSIFSFPEPPNRSSQNSYNSSSHHMIICLSPKTPLTPNRLAELHSPTRVDTPRDVDDEEEDDIDHTNDHRKLLIKSPIKPHHASWNPVEPLSATLKKIGAARSTGYFTIVDEEEEEQYDNDNNNGKEKDIKFAAPQHWNEKIDKKLEEYKKAQALLKNNREATEKAKEVLFTNRKPNDVQNTHLNVIQSKHRGVPKNSMQQSYDNNESSTVLWNSMKRMSQTLTSYLFGNHFRARTLQTDVFFPVQASCNQQPKQNVDVQQPQSTHSLHSRGDGWGGLRPRTSWFPDLRLGPLLSPPGNKSDGNQDGNIIQGGKVRLKSFHLKAQASKVDIVRQFPQNDDSDLDWVDEDEHLVETSNDQTETTSDQTILQSLRVRFPSQLPAPHKQRREAWQKYFEESEKGGSKPATLATYTDTSAEGRPITSKLKRYKLAILLFLMASVGVLVCIVVVSIMHHHNHQAQQTTPIQSNTANQQGNGTIIIPTSNSGENIILTPQRRSLILEAVMQSE